ncbi:MAG: hypothetical protein IT455_00145 [Planctomycetes bacterium]|nr:hypothetical protein [Planctomycetota bacterium]
MAAVRQRLADRLLLVANLVAANAAAAWFVVVFTQPGIFTGGADGPFATLAAELSSKGRVALLPLEPLAAWLTLLAAVGLLVWNFAWLVRRREVRPPSNWIISDTPSGPVRIAREAIEVGLQKAGEALPEVTRLRVQVDTSAAKRILVTGQFQCAEGTNNLTASQRLRQAMMDRFGEMVRPTDGARVEYDMEFQGFAGKLGKKGADVPMAVEPPPFTGPQYPIDDDSSSEGNA